MSHQCRLGSSIRARAVAIAIACIAGTGCSSKAVIDPISAPRQEAFAPELVRQGERLAALGNCITCHTAKNGKPYAGGFPVKTPFGIVHGTNLTPDAATGIGTWSEAAFARAMREGIDREGRHLYPAFPYDHFTLLSDDDVRALYAYLMTRQPVRADIPDNTIKIPRAAVAIWKSMYFRPGRFVADASRDPVLVRGQYLAEGLAHCGACHTPRNRLGAEKKDEAYSGGEVGGWHAPALNAKSPSPVPWTVEAMTQYLKTGMADAHAIAAGPMDGVVDNLADAAPDDVAALARYAASLDTRDRALRDAQMAKAKSLPPRGSGPAADGHPGALLYAGSCAECHDRGRNAEGGALQLSLAIAPALPTPANLIHIVRDGIVPKAHERSGWMPPFATALTDDELANVVAYVRTFSGYPPWSDVPREIRAAAKARE